MLFRSTAITAAIQSGCGITGITSYELDKAADAVSLYPNPFTTSVNVMLKDVSTLNSVELRLYDITGAEIRSTTITKQVTTFDNLPSGIYFYRAISNNKQIQSGKLVSIQ